MVSDMSNRSEIQKAIEQLPPSEIEALHAWLACKTEERIEREWHNPHATREDVAAWLRGAVGVGIPGVTTDSVMRETREG